MNIKVNGIKALNGNHFDLELTDLMIFYGGNSSGKSSIILGAAQFFDLNKNLGINADYISPDRFSTSGQIDSKKFGQTDNQNTMPRKSYNNNESEVPGPDAVAELSWQDKETQNKIIGWFNANFEEIRIIKKELDEFRSEPEITIGGMNPILQGTGARSILSIVVQLFNPKINVLSIDEPEISLEPKNQKKLFQLIKNASKGLEGLPKKNILIATHSHLFLDREIITNNYQVIKTDGKVIVKPVSTEQELNGGIYNLLGSNPTDLFFPGNIVVVEGRSDSIFLVGVLEKMIQHNLCENKKVVFHFLEGFDKALTGTIAIDQMFKTQSYFSVYRDIICGLFDKPTQNKKIVDEIRSLFGDNENKRFIILEQPAIEYYYPLKAISHMFKNSTLTSDQYEKELEEFFKQVKADHKGVGKLFEQEISKVKLAKAVVDYIKNETFDINQINKKILSLLETAVDLSF